ncbi:hypothetical protein I9X38_07120 [Bacillus mojavensis]|nr:hypothetical protein I9X38_07120 [Bacillus mojavensis]
MMSSCHLTLSIHGTNFNIARLDVTIQASESDKCISLDIDYRTKLFKRSTVERLLMHCARLLEDFAAESEKPMSEEDLHSEQEAG